MTPKAWHAYVVMFSQCLFTIGESYAVLLLYLDDPNMKDLNWRRLLIQAAMLPLVLLVMACFFFPRVTSLSRLERRYRRSYEGAAVDAPSQWTA
jgi:hypothetical protein